MKLKIPSRSKLQPPLLHRFHLRQFLFDFCCNTGALILLSWKLANSEMISYKRFDLIQAEIFRVVCPSSLDALPPPPVASYSCIRPATFNSVVDLAFLYLSVLFTLFSSLSRLLSLYLFITLALVKWNSSDGSIHKVNQLPTWKPCR